jgi:hypothetical protein
MLQSRQDSSGPVCRWPTSILTGMIAIGLLVACFAFDVRVSMAHAERPKAAAVFFIFWGLLMLWGTTAGHRLAWRMTRVVAFVGSLFSILGPVWCVVAMVRSGPPPLWAVAFVLFLCVDFCTIWFSFDRPSAMHYFRLVCPRCGRLTYVGDGPLFRRAKCRLCGEVWT